MSNFPLYSSQNGSSVRLEPVEEAELQEGNDGEIQESDRNIEALPTPGRTASRRDRPIGRPPGRRRGSTTSSSRALTRPIRPCTRSRGRTETRAQAQTLERAMTLPNIEECMSPEEREHNHQHFHRSHLTNYDVKGHHDTGAEPVVPATVAASN